MGNLTCLLCNKFLIATSMLVHLECQKAFNLLYLYVQYFFSELSIVQWMVSLIRKVSVNIYGVACQGGGE